MKIIHSFLSTFSLFACTATLSLAQDSAPAVAEAPKEQEEDALKSVRMLVSDGLIGYNTDSEAMITDMKATIAKINGAAKKHKLPDLTGKVKLTFSSTNEASIVLETMPKLNPKIHQQLTDDLNAGLKNKTQYFDMPIVLIFEVGIGDPNKRKFEKDPTAQEQRVAKIKAVSIEEARAVIKNYVNTIAIPITTHILQSVDPKFEGVRGMGDTMAKLDYTKPIDVKKAIDENFNYWRGIMEMQRNNPLVTNTRPLLHAANGNFDHAARYLDLYKIFVDEKIETSSIVLELGEMLRAHAQKVNTEINKGIKLHDQGKYDAAGKIYTALLAKYPYSALATYEVWFAENTKQLMANKDKEGWGDKDFLSWKTARKKIYAIDPLFGMDVRARSEREQFMLIRRVQMNALIEGGMGKKELVQYADIAKDLGVYNFSAEMYWLIVGNLKPEDYDNRDLADLFFYGAYKAGSKEVADVMKTDIKKLIKEQDADLERRIKKKQTKQDEPR